MESATNTQNRTPLTINDVAAKLGVTPWKVYDLAARGLLPGAFRVGRTWRFIPEKIDHFIENGGTAQRISA